MWRRGGAMRGLVETGLHKDEAQFGGGFAEELADGIEDLGSVLGDEADDFAVDVDAVFAEDGFNFEILAGRDADELGDFEISGAEAVEESDEAGGGAARDGEGGGGRSPPG